jgi:hypothetical protein
LERGHLCPQSVRSTLILSRFALIADKDVRAPGCLILMTPRKII